MPLFIKNVKKYIISSNLLNSKVRADLFLQITLQNYLTFK